MALCSTKYGFSFRNQKEWWRGKVRLSFFFGKKADKSRNFSRIKIQKSFKDKDSSSLGNKVFNEHNGVWISALFLVSGVQFTFKCKMGMILFIYLEFLGSFNWRNEVKIHLSKLPRTLMSYWLVNKKLKAMLWVSWQYLCILSTQPKTINTIQNFVYWMLSVEDHLLLFFMHTFPSRDYIQSCGLKYS